MGNKYCLNNLFLRLAVLITVFAPGCHYGANVPIGLALFRSPITFDFRYQNGPLLSGEQCRLKQIAKTLSDVGPIMSSTEHFNTNFGFRYMDRVKIFKEYFRADIPDCSEMKPEEQARIDTMEDLVRSDTIVLVSISGGGARAAALAAHTMSLLETEYNTIISRLPEQNGKSRSLASLIDVYSTVSGGSLYASQVALAQSQLLRASTGGHLPPSNSNTLGGFNDDCASLDSHVSDPALSNFDRNFFSILGNKGKLLSPSKLGDFAARWYLSPGNLFFGPLSTFLTTSNYLDVLAGGLNFLHEGNSWLLEKEYDVPVRKKESIFAQIKKAQLSLILSYPRLASKIGELCPKPRFFFDATVLEAGLPFVFTQSIIHVPSDKPFLLSARLSNPRAPKNLSEAIRPLPRAYTLEDIGSSPMKMNFPYAVMASASFPLGLEPLHLQKYAYHPGDQSITESSEVLHVTDGGVYDNSGLAVLKEMIDFIRQARRTSGLLPARFIIVGINADASEYDVLGPAKPAPLSPWYRSLIPFRWVDLPLSPFRFGALGYDALNLIHYGNKRRAETLALSDYLKEACPEDKKEDMKNCEDSSEKRKSDHDDVTFFPVNVAQLSSHDEYKISHVGNLYEDIRSIPTDYTLTSDEDLTIARAAEVIISTEQEIGWELEPTCQDGKRVSIKKLGKAFVFSVLAKVVGTEEQRELIQGWCQTSN